jgi:KipI family sensor histidine kinase inhibitor
VRFLRAGRCALLVELDDLQEVIGLHAALRREPAAGVVDLVPAARTLLVTFDAAPSYGRIAEWVRGRRLAPVAAQDPGTPVELVVTYDGEDLAEVARLTGLAAVDVVRRHQRGDYVVAFSGFAPGFGYLVGGDPALRVPRRDTPRTRVPAGSVALAGEFTGVYPRAGPGGWQLIGRTDAVLWDLSREPPALLTPGTRVRFTAETA